MIKEKLLKFVKLARKLFIILSCVALPALMVCLVFAFSGAMAFYIITPVLFVAYLVLYGVYAMCFSMGVVIGLEVTDKVVHLKTKRKTFTYDVRMGCVEMKVHRNRFVGTFQTQDSRDKFTFYRRLPFGKYYEEQFTVQDIAAFYPDVYSLLEE